MKSYTQKDAEVIYHPLFQGIYIKWKDFSNDEQFKATIEAAFDISKNHTCKCWIEEMTLGRAVSNVSTEWVRDEVFQKVATLGIRKVAFLLEKNPMRKLYVENIRESIRMAGLQYKAFESRMEMDKWIREQEPMKLSDIRLNAKSVLNQFY